MSCYVANPEAFGLLAAYAHKAGLVQQPEDAAELLARENIRSVAARYPGDADGERPGPALLDADIVKAARIWAAHYVAEDRTPLSVVVWTACRNVAYQCDESYNWEKTPAFALLQRIQQFIGHEPIGSVPWCFEDYDAPAEVEALYGPQEVE
jgi:hypothetical protein